MKHPDFHQLGGVERHHDGSFTIYGVIENPDRTIFSQRFYDYNFEDARERFQKELKKESEKYFVGE